MRSSSIRLVLGIFIVTLALGGFIGVGKVFADNTSQCADPTSKNYKSCTECDCKVLAVIPPGNKVTGATASAVLKCSKTGTCKNPGQPNVCSNIGNKLFDLNCDGLVNTVDYNIAVKCAGCCAQASPFK